MEKIAFLGLGIMGQGMAHNLLKAGYPLTVWNRTARKCTPFVKRGATKAAMPAEAVQDADVILYCLADDAAVESVVFGPQGILEGVHSGQVAVNMTTQMPALSLREAAAYKAKGVHFLDAPVFGSKNEAANAGLWIVVGGERRVFERVKPILEKLSETTHYMGGHGKGTSMKLVGNLIVASQLHALGEAMILATKAGLNPRDVLGVLHVTDFKSPIFDGVGSMLVERNFETHFALKLMLKDANLIARFAEQLRAPTPASAVIRETIKAAVNQGWGEENASALIKALEMQAGVEVKA
ncbi:MAG: NAD(P)-dependent oxidoreductase [Anaerolineae bacterium]|nr:NAD(P)-dependent oxidoreductase [Thermoflexales bacterium]MDW8406719.1 NAD(P)-dependent oxidoreductase [Anaerolineae bacterium]